MEKASLQHWFDATPAWKCPRNCLTQPCHEFGQGSCRASESKSDFCADDGPTALRNSIRDKWLWPDLFSNNKYVTMIGWAGGGGWGGSSCWDGHSVEWFWVSKCNHSCWNSVAESFVKASYLAKTKICPPGYSRSATYSATECLPFLCRVWAWSCYQLQTVANTDGDRTTTV